MNEEDMANALRAMQETARKQQHATSVICIGDNGDPFVNWDVAANYAMAWDLGVRDTPQALVAKVLMDLRESLSKPRIIVQQKSTSKQN